MTVRPWLPYQRLAARGRVFGRKASTEFGTLFTHDTILRGHRQIVAKKLTHPRRRPSRPSIDAAVKAFIIQLANQNASWGCDRIAGELKKLGHTISDATMKNVLKAGGIDLRLMQTQDTACREFQLRIGNPWRRLIVP